MYACMYEFVCVCVCVCVCSPRVTIALVVTNKPELLYDVHPITAVQFQERKIFHKYLCSIIEIITKSHFKLWAKQEVQ